MSEDLLAALTRDHWERANRELIAKLLTELMFEDVLMPERVEGTPGEADFTLAFPGGLELTFSGRLRSLGHWRVAPASVAATRDGVPSALPDASEVVALGAPMVGADATTTAGLIGEVAQTLVSDAYQLARGRPVAELLDRDPLALEGEMRGHPWIVASKGRVGFGADDLAAYSPEAQQPLRLTWLAIDPDVADVRGLDHHATVRDQLGADGWDDLRGRASAAGVDPDAAVYVPVHPWQWQNRILALHAGELARREIVPLGELPPRYLPQQSLRTLVDVDDPTRRYLKLPLSILNTSVYRGLPRERTLAAPALSEWFVGRCDADPFLTDCGLILLGEVASVSVAHPAFSAVAGVPYQHTEMLGAIWRDPVAPHLHPGERAITLAALIHRDPTGASFAAALIERCGIGVGEWVERLHEATLPPLIHVLYRLGATFSPHAQNCMLVLREDRPERLVVKDFVDDAMIAAEPLPELAALPAPVRAALGEGVEGMILSQWVQCGLLVCVHRYLAEILADDLGYPEAAFWAAARASVDAYQERFASELGDRFDLFDLDAPAFVKLCLNRVRLLERGYADAADRPVASAVGWIDNPLAAVVAEP